MLIQPESKEKPDFSREVPLRRGCSLRKLDTCFGLALNDVFATRFRMIHGYVGEIKSQPEKKDDPIDLDTPDLTKSIA